MSRAPRQKSNVALLTEGASYIQRAKKARKEAVEEIKFDDEARREWLTGFSKRKKAKAEEKRSRAQEREKQEHLEERRKARKELKERAAENVKSVRIAMGLEPLVDDEEDDEMPQAGPSTSKEKEIEEEFSDDDQIATVTVTEDFDFTAPVYPVRSGSPTSSADGEEVEEHGEVDSKAKSGVKFLPPSSKRAQKKDDKKKEKKKEVKSKSMETPAEKRREKDLVARRTAKKNASMQNKLEKYEKIMNKRGAKKRSRGIQPVKAAKGGKPVKGKGKR